MPDALSNLRTTRQSKRATPGQVRNSAGGRAFAVDPVTRLRRFLVLGTDGGTYYSTERALTRETAEVVMAWASARTLQLVEEIVSISTAGRAPRNNPALFALAAAAALGDAEGRGAALAALPRVARTATHLFTFADYIGQFRGWGRGLRRAVADWYTNRPLPALTYQVVKYRQREGWSHRDLLRLAHPVTDEAPRARLFDWICGRSCADTEMPPLVDGFARAQLSTTAADWVSILRQVPTLSWEMLPDTALAERTVWAQLIENGLPQTALLRQLPRLTRLGLLSPGSTTLGLVVAQLTDLERLRRARVHPVSVLVAARTYARGVGAGRTSWEPVGAVVDALDAAFYAAFRAVEPAGRRTLLALDVSGSMGLSMAGRSITAREASVALALVTAATEPHTDIVGFTSATGPASRSMFGLRRRPALDGISRLPVSPRQRLDDVLSATAALPFGGTDCALPMLWARANRVEVDTFVIYTDNETWAGSVQPHEALRQYRDASGIDARLAVVGLTATDFSIADPADPGMLDIAGFDAALPNLLTDFSARRV